MFFFLIEVLFDFFYLKSLSIMSKAQFSGITNLGATCYINVIFQVLINIPEFKAKLINTDPKVIKKSDVLDEDKDCMIKFIKFAKEYGTKRCMNVKELIKSFAEPWNNTRIQQDPQEFSRYLVNLFLIIYKNLPESKGNYIAPVNPMKLFSINSKCYSKCNRSGCNYTKETEFKDDFQIFLPPKHLMNFNQSMVEWCDSEVMKDFICPKCKQRGTVEKRYELIDFPEYFMFFIQITQNHEGENIKVSYQLKVNKIEIILGQKYHFVAGIKHVGLEWGMGHYKCDILKDNDYYHFNDRKPPKLISLEQINYDQEVNYEEETYSILIFKKLHQDEKKVNLLDDNDSNLIVKKPLRRSRRLKDIAYRQQLKLVDGQCIDLTECKNQLVVGDYFRFIKEDQYIGAKVIEINSSNNKLLHVAIIMDDEIMADVVDLNKVKVDYFSDEEDKAIFKQKYDKIIDAEIALLNDENEEDDDVSVNQKALNEDDEDEDEDKDDEMQQDEDEDKDHEMQQDEDETEDEDDDMGPCAYSHLDMGPRSYSKNLQSDGDMDYDENDDIVQLESKKLEKSKGRKRSKGSKSGKKLHFINILQI